MRGLIEGTFFLGLATAAHLVAWAPTPDAGIQAAGDGGDALLTLAAASASVAQMVEDWETPPDVPSPNMAQPTLTATDISSSDMAGPKPPLPALAAPAPAPRMAALALPRNDAMPRVMTAPASPPPAAPKPVAPPPPGAAPTPPPQAEEPTETEVAPPPPPERQIVQAPSDTEPRPTTRPKRPPKPQTMAKAKAKAEPQPKPKANLNSASSESKRAAGTGARGAKGDNGANAEATLSKSARASLMSKWGSQIRATIARNVPRGTGKGTAVVHITLGGSGQLIATKLQKSSGNPAIDQAALRAVKNAGRFPPAPAALGSGRRSFAVPIRAR